MRSRPHDDSEAEVIIMRRMYPYLLIGIPCLVVGAIFAIRSSADENDESSQSTIANYHVILFASEREGNPPRFSHTWATFVKSSRNDSDKPTVDESITISWLPEGGAIPPLAVVRGRNSTLPETLDWARQLNARVAAWGPIPIRKELYELASQRKQVLESGSLAYKMIDGRVRPERGTNCIHAVSDMVPGALLQSGTAHGEDGTRMVADHLRGYMLTTETSDPEILELLGVQRNTVEHRTLDAAVRR
jgi:hypothetical protein